MLYCDKQTYQDLEFDVIISLLESFCVGETAATQAKDIEPINGKAALMTSLLHVNELLSIRKEGYTFPQLDFEELTGEIRMLPIKNSSLSQESFVRLRMASDLVNRIIYFFNKQEEEYPNLVRVLEDAYFTNELIEAIDKVFDKRGLVKDDASEALFEIRQRIKSVQQQINRNFERDMRKWLKAGYLSDTKETFHDNRRLLAVLSTHKRQVPGQISGSSKTGNVTFVEPQSNALLNAEFDQLHDDERKEIFKILKVLTSECAVHLPLIRLYQTILTTFDYINARCRLALRFNAVLPGIVEEQRIDLMDAYHPVLLLANQDTDKKTMPQSITMDKFSRMLVISGPNAGGKSITLKTVGLLQLMLQCGLLVPVNPNSKMCFFQSLLTDIGDNQSIANELSTYSYRLKRMKHFLEVSNKRTLLLLDEFGTGSDPDLGGALAEVFFETLYNKRCFGVITTHYANIKLKADQLKNAINGCMLFDTETLQPLFKFSIGQPGSSFTFEVAQINGIPTDLIEQAKGKLDDKKVKMDRLLSELQKEKSYLSRLNKEHITAQQLAEQKRQEYIQSKEKLDEKLVALKTRSEQDSKLVSLGKKLQSFIDAYKPKGKGKNVNVELINEVKKYIAVEKSKIEEVKLAEQLKQKTQKNKQKKVTPENDPNRQHLIKVGSSVKIIATKQKGEVEAIDGDDVTVVFGFMRLKVKKNKLMWVE